ncbi:uncharacterized protein [Anabrus simplex]|uniref:uncharacterized protein n=1 Tax=Anabrus simplex TaxID=316456 RepID=UPI0035A33C0A
MSPSKTKKPNESRKVNVKSPSKTKTPDRKSSSRKPKIYRLPVYKVKKIMKKALAATRYSDTDSCVEAIAQDALHLAIKATEGFLVELMKRSYAHANNPKELTYDHVAEFINSEPTLAFSKMRGMVPRKVKCEDILKNAKTQKKGDPPLIGWMEVDKFKYNETTEQRIKRLISDKYCGGYYKMVFTGDKSYLQDKNYWKSRLKIWERQKRMCKNNN